MESHESSHDQPGQILKAAAWLFAAAVVLGPLSYGPAARGRGTGYVGSVAALFLIYGFPWLFSSDLRVSRSRFPGALTRLSYVTVFWAVAMAVLTGAAVKVIDEPLAWHEMTYLVATVAYTALALVLAVALRKPAAWPSQLALVSAAVFLTLLSFDLALSIYQVFTEKQVALAAALPVFAGKGFRLFHPVFVIGLLMANRQHRYGAAHSVDPGAEPSAARIGSEGAT